MKKVFSNIMMLAIIFTAFCFTACGGDDKTDNGNNIKKFSYSTFVGDFSFKLTNFTIEKGNASFLQIGKIIHFNADGSCKGLSDMESFYVLNNGVIETYYQKTNEPMFKYTLIEETAHTLKVNISGTLDDNLQATLIFEKIIDDDNSEEGNTNDDNSGEGDTNDDKPQVDHYYVKYEASSYAGNGTFGYISVQYTKENLTNGSISKENRNSKGCSWEGTFGPFKKGDFVRLRVGGSYKLTGRIYVALNNEPFVLKAEGETTGELSLEISCYI